MSVRPGTGSVWGGQLWLLCGELAVHQSIMLYI